MPGDAAHALRTAAQALSCVTKVRATLRQSAPIALARPPMCVTVHALLSALVRRIDLEGYAPSRAELAALLRAGCPRADVARALSQSDAPAFRAARATFEQLPDR